MSSSPSDPILIIGAGISGLTLAQALCKRKIPFLIFDRDVSAQSRPQGWALTIHFARDQFLELLPDDVVARLHEAQVDPLMDQDKSSSTFLNVLNCHAKWRAPPTYGNRIRLIRERLRNVLLHGLDVQWGKKLETLEEVPSGVSVLFEDGTRHNGCLAVGADGSRSRVRRLLYGEELAKPTSLPACFLGTSAHATEEQVMPLLDLDQTLFQGCHPLAPIWMWFSVMEKPEMKQTGVTDPLWRVQICISWLTETSTEQREITGSNPDRVQLMREKSKDFHPLLRNIFWEILSTDHGPIVHVPMEYWWIPLQSKQSKLSSRVTVVGDAAHTMPLYRGEGFNHAVVDVHRLLGVIEQIRTDPFSVSTALSSYETEVRERGKHAALMCRDACLEVHQWEALGDHSVVRQKTSSAM